MTRPLIRHVAAAIDETSSSFEGIRHVADLNESNRLAAGAPGDEQERGSPDSSFSRTRV